MVKILLTVFAIIIFFGSAIPSFDEAQARQGDDQKGTLNKYEEPYQYWFTMPNP